MFFSPPSFPRALNQKKDDCVQKAREGMGNPGKAWEIPGTAKSPGQQNTGKSRARSASIYIKWKRFYSFVPYLLLQFWSQEAEIWTQTPRNIVDAT